VGCCVVATVAALLVVTLHSRSAESALDEAASRTLRDYTGYAGRLMGSEMLRRFSEQRARVLAPVIGSSGRPVAPPSLEEIARIGDRELDFGPSGARGYFRLDLRTGALDGRGSMTGSLGAHVADTLRTIAARRPAAPDPNVLVLVHDSVQYGVAYATYADPTGKPLAIYGLGYRRTAGISYWATRVFRETPLLPTSYAGSRWNYDTTALRPGEVRNGSLLSVRVGDRAGHLLWHSPGAAPTGREDIRERAVISTSAGGFTIETALLPGGQPVLVPAVMRRAQRWSMRALLVLTTMLAAISLIALLSERVVARARRIEAMQQLALGLRHELNNALASVLLNAELVAEHPGLDESVRERLGVVAEQAQRMRDVLRRLEKREQLDVIVPYRDEGFMVDLSAPATEPLNPESRRDT
jgi:His Kinase A (phosphoacceptor) domain.